MSLARPCSVVRLSRCGYQIVDRVGLTFQTLKELYAIQNQVAFLARQRVGGKVVLPEAISVLKIG